MYDSMYPNLCVASMYNISPAGFFGLCLVFFRHGFVKHRGYHLLRLGGGVQLLSTNHNIKHIPKNLGIKKKVLYLD